MKGLLKFFEYFVSSISCQRKGLSDDVKPSLALAQKKEADELLFVKERAKSLKIDIAGRLEWLEDAWFMIEKARNSRNEALR